MSTDSLIHRHATLAEVVAEAIRRAEADAKEAEVKEAAWRREQTERAIKELRDTVLYVLQYEVQDSELVVDQNYRWDSGVRVSWKPEVAEWFATVYRGGLMIQTPCPSCDGHLGWPIMDLPDLGRYLRGEANPDYHQHWFDEDSTHPNARKWDGESLLTRHPAPITTEQQLLDALRVFISETFDY